MLLKKKTSQALVRGPKCLKNSGKISSTPADFPILSLVIATLISSSENGADIVSRLTANFLRLESFFLISVVNCLCDEALDISIIRLAMRFVLIFGRLDFEDPSDPSLRRRRQALRLECLKSVFSTVLIHLSRR